ncbi:hypothetical protein JAAARDRAFT_130261 [Jaapia argillacea MUCL 33604]|uniref:AAA+ ATPase domain-containing protein n=1 Tax=Jaapia argillacea MUCL 33604 TaxID=933084 RepID=A0A067PUJ9_9AGAM|nr:hypothetical protein JAAARDRAFT_130261 [Jaapia argillacea MUCL 33604]
MPIQPRSAEGANKRALQSRQPLGSPPPKRQKLLGPSAATSLAPLAERLRPGSLEDFVGQKHLIGSDSLLMNLVSDGLVGSMILWGPPGCGKTTLARLLASHTNAIFKELSATDVGIKEIRAVFEDARRSLASSGKKTILFLDEVHRFNKAQQDIFLPYVEQGHIQLIGATTENPSFKVTGALLSRCRVFVLERLTDEDISEIITRAIERLSSAPSQHEPTQTGGSAPQASPSLVASDEHPSSSQSSTSTAVGGSSTFSQVTPRVLSSIVSLSSGDARTALSLVELVTASSKDVSEAKLLSLLRRSVSTSYDRTGDDRYDMISALHKSVRGSDGNAAMYWLARMLTAGEDPMYIVRRMVVCASEDIGLADNHALPLAMATLQACQTIGMPECRINLAHLVSYLSEAPKSTRAYEAYNRAEAAAKLDPTIPVPMQARNAPTKLMKQLGYSQGYRYNPEYAYVDMSVHEPPLIYWHFGRHPVHNEYMPIQFKGEVFLQKEGDLSGKVWDEDALRQWELEVNRGRDWEGRAGGGGTEGDI